MQVYLLRFLEQKTIERLGGKQSIQVNARVIAATHVNLEEAVADGRFREDLYYRLNVLSILVPRLADRGNDIELLARYFLHKFGKEYGTSSRGFTRQAVGAMLNHAWPGNVREMINRIRRALVMSENRMITPADLGLQECETLDMVMLLEQARAHAEELAGRSCLSHAMNNVSKAAKLLGVSRVTPYPMRDKSGVRCPPSAPTQSPPRPADARGSACGSDGCRSGLVYTRPDRKSTRLNSSHSQISLFPLF